MKIFITCLFLINCAFAGEYYSVSCKEWGDQNTFTLNGEIEESGTSFLDGFLNLEVKKAGGVIFSKSRIDSMGFFQLAYLDGQLVYLAELIPTNRTDYTFLNIAGNHPRPSGNSILTYKGEQYFAECEIK
ncbi:MAG: hypothetical protein KC493_00115 [Bacteriovoracaceae bacterium]|nr:hypothetical protein [Bacteriovoracaceae bacterium]